MIRLLRGGPEQGAAPLDLPAVEPRGARRLRVPSWTPVAAVLTWLVCVLLSRPLVAAWDANPLTTQGVLLPLALGAVVGLALLAVSLWRSVRVMTGIVAGAYSGWVYFTITAALNGTPFGYGSMSGDAGRMSALVMHFSTTWHNTDAADPRLPAEYPPLYPMLVGRVAAWSGHDAWSLLGAAQAAVLSAAVLICFLLWARLVHPGLALLLAAALPMGLDEPSKANEVLALGVLVPWLLAAFWPPPGRRRLHPVVAGVIGGLMVPWYPSLLMVSLLGVAALLVGGWWTSVDRRGYLRDAALSIGIAFVLASWYVVPLVRAYAKGTQEVVADTYLSGTLVDDPLGLVTSSVDVFNALRVIGLLGTVLLLRRAWWAPPVAMLVAAVELTRAVMLLRLVGERHAFLLYYAQYVTRYTMLAAGLLVLGHVAAPSATHLLGRRLAVRPAATVVAATFLALTALAGWRAWMPAPRGMLDVARGSSTQIGPDEDPKAEWNNATRAHAERRPDGTAPRYQPTVLIRWFPAQPVLRAIHASQAGDDPVVLSYDQRLFSYEPLRNYLPPDRSSTSALIRWDSRHAELSRLAGIADPQAFAQAAGHTAFGPLDVFVLQRVRGRWWFRGVAFDPAQFAGSAFTVTSIGDGSTIVAVRRS